MGFFKHFIFKSGKSTSYTWVQDSNHQWILKAEFEKADLDTYYDKGPSSEGLGISVENRPTKQVFVYYPEGRSYSGQTYVSYDCQSESGAGLSAQEVVRTWRFFYTFMSTQMVEYYDEIDPHFLYIGYAQTSIEESLYYNNEDLEDSFIFISYGLYEAAPKNSFWGRLKYQISKFFKFSQTDCDPKAYIRDPHGYEIALREKVKKALEEREKEYLKEREEFEKYSKLAEEYNKQVLTEEYNKQVLAIEKKYKIDRIYLPSELEELRKKYGSDKQATSKSPSIGQGSAFDADGDKK